MSSAEWLPKIARISCRTPSFPRHQAHRKMYKIETRERDQEHQPAGKLMKETQCLVGIPVLHAQSGAEDPCHIGRDRDGQTGEREHYTTPSRPLQKIAVDDSHCE